MWVLQETCFTTCQQVRIVGRGQQSNFFSYIFSFLVLGFRANKDKRGSVHRTSESQPSDARSVRTNPEFSFFGFNVCFYLGGTDDEFLKYFFSFSFSFSVKPNEALLYIRGMITFHGILLVKLLCGPSSTSHFPFIFLYKEFMSCLADFLFPHSFLFSSKFCNIDILLVHVLVLLQSIKIWNINIINNSNKKIQI